MTTNRVPWHDTRYDEELGRFVPTSLADTREGIQVTEQDMAEARKILALTPAEEHHAFLTGYLGNTLEQLSLGCWHGRMLVRALALYRAHRELAREATP